MALNWRQQTVLRNLSKAGREIPDISEPYRQAAIDLGMMDPPLVQVDGPLMTITDAGRAALDGKRV